MIEKILEHHGADLHRVRETGWQPVKCPYHDDRNASASVNLTLGGFRCHACGVSGDAIKLLMDREGMDFLSAKRFAEEISGESHGDVRRPTTRERPKRVSQWRTRLFS